MTEKNNFQLDEALDKHLFDSHNGPKDYVSKPGIKPSELGSPCLRKNYYVFHRVESSFSFEVPNIIAKDAGDAFHTLVRKWLRDSGFLIENLDWKTGEIPLSFIDKKTPDPEFPIYAMDVGVRYAKVDGIIEIPEGFDNSGLWVTEIKSKKPDKFHRVTGPDRDSYQGTFYAFTLEEALRAGKFRHIPRLKNKSDIRGTIYIYIDRGTGDRKIYWEEKSPEMMVKIIEKCLKIMDYAEKKQLPPKTQDFCKWCNFRDKCAVEWNVDT